MSGWRDELTEMFHCSNGARLQHYTDKYGADELLISVRGEPVHASLNVPRQELEKFLASLRADDWPKTLEEIADITAKELPEL